MEFMLLFFRGGEPISKIEMDNDTKLFKCGLCFAPAKFESPQKFEVVLHFLEFHFNLDRSEFEICQWCMVVYADLENFNNHVCQSHGRWGIPRKVNFSLLSHFMGYATCQINAFWHFP